MNLTVVYTVAKSIVGVLSIIIQLSAMPFFLVDQPIVIHCVFLFLLSMIFLKNWYWAVGAFFVGTVLVTQLSEVSTIPLTVSYGIGMMIFLFFSEFLFKSRSAGVVGMNAVVSTITMLTAHQVLLRMIGESEQFFLPTDQLVFFTVSFLCHAVILLALAFAGVPFDARFNTQSSYVK